MASTEAKAKATFEAKVPKGAAPGGRFVAVAPNGQLVQVEVPEGCQPGDTVPVHYVPLPPAALAGAPTATVVGVPVARACSLGDLEQGARSTARLDAEAGSMGWAMYALGWCVCCLLGPFGPLFWLCTWMTHRLRPKEQRDLFRRERAVANFSCCTAVVASLMQLALFALLLQYWRTTTGECAAMLRHKSCRRYLSGDALAGASTQYFCSPQCGPARCYNDHVFGGSDGVYASSSLICGAALHAGAVEEGVGGLVRLTVVPAPDAYGASFSHGLRSIAERAGGGWGFTVSAVAPAAAEVPPATNVTQVDAGSNGTTDTPVPSAPTQVNATAATPGYPGSASTTLLPTAVVGPAVVGPSAPATGGTATAAPSGPGSR